MSEREAWLRAFHAAQPGITARVFARGGTYAHLAAKVPSGAARVLDLACGDGALLELLGTRGIGADVSLDEVARAKRWPVVQARAQALPFADASFDAATCHLAFMLFDDIGQVVAELARVLRPGAPFMALVGGGPTADGDDAFHCFARALSPSGTPGFGDRRASREDGWRELFATWRDISFERRPIDLGGTFGEVWAFLSASYQLRDADRARIRDEVRHAFAGDHVPCTVATYVASARRG